MFYIFCISEQNGKNEKGIKISKTIKIPTTLKNVLNKNPNGLLTPSRPDGNLKNKSNQNFLQTFLRNRQNFDFHL